MLIRTVLTVLSAVTLPPGLDALPGAAPELLLPRPAAELLVPAVPALDPAVTAHRALPRLAPHLVRRRARAVSLVLAEHAVLHPVTDSRGLNTGLVSALEVIQGTSTLGLVLAPRAVLDPITLPGLLDTVPAGAGHVRREAAAGLVTSVLALSLSVTHEAPGQTGAILTSPLLILVTWTASLVTAVLKIIEL